MALITPRRRFLITAPLALLLPAGLLTYLGLQVVHGIEDRYEQQVHESVQEIVNSVRNKTSLQLKYVIQQPFKEMFQSQVLPELNEEKQLERVNFTLSNPMPYARQIFIYYPPDRLSFYKRSPAWDEGDTQVQWVPSEPPSIPLVARLKSEMDVAAYREGPNYVQVFRDDFRTITYPSEPGELLTERDRQLVTFTWDSQVENGVDDEVDENRNHENMVFYGFLFDFEYINNTFFPDLLEEMWKMEGELKYPIRITDFQNARPVATTPVRMGSYDQLGIDTESRRVFEDSREHYSRPFHDSFPWYWIYFSSETGKDVMDIAAYEKMVYYCLIAAANIIMIVGVFGALRNIAKELEIADMRSDFVARVSHELRTPLGLIRLFAETLEMDRTKDEEKRKEYLHAITKESERLSHLITNILNFSLIESGKKSYATVETDIEDVVYETVETIKYHMERGEFELDINIADDVPRLRCDPEAIQQALYNLLSNAMKYSGDSRKIRIDVENDRDGIAIHVTDYGIGIEAGHLRKIFQEFYRVEDPRVRQTGGSGLGLALVKHIAEGHGGRLTVESEPGEGSRFTVYLPIDGP